MIYLPVGAAFFDNNGTLQDDLKVSYGSKDATFRHFGLDPPSDEVFRQEITSQYMDFYFRHGVPKDATPDIINAIRKVYYDAHDTEAQFRPDAKETVLACKAKGLKTAIVSAEANTLHAKLEKEGFRESECFDHVRLNAYPKVQHLREVADALKIPPSRVLYVDDTVEGNSAANEVGMISVGFVNPTAFHLEERVRKVAKFCIRNLSDLLPRLQVCNGIVFCRIGK